MRLHNRKRSILITGCSTGGAGHALALEFAAQGLRVFATARSTKSLIQLEEKGIEMLPLDVTKIESINTLKDEISKRTGGKLDILFNNAGTMYEAPAIEASPARIRSMYDTNVFGVFNMISTFTPLLLASVSPSSGLPPTIINTSSILSRLPYPFAAAYNASKAAVSSYTDTLRIELAPLGIKVVTLFMGEVATGLMSDSITFGAESLYHDFEERLKERTRNHVKNSMKPELFAKQVASVVILKNPGIKEGEYIWKGTNAWIVWLLNVVGWRKIFDRTVEAPVGLDKKELRKALFEKGQRSVKVGG
ncbi:NAD(P)-binding protein [Glonium stellatum]|uniref:NAD(P)-binding protein n=1 Tax=Glonium stellatum TaxID=574774 RepID=A0A8E2JYG2_9PEZI|nr:NAD(P)-binding protein [Glonium stellatum]